MTGAQVFFEDGDGLVQGIFSLIGTVKRHRPIRNGEGVLVGQEEVFVSLVRDLGTGTVVAISPSSRLKRYQQGVQPNKP